MDPSRFHPRRRTYRLFWCYQCHRAIHIISFPNSGVLCPRCYGQFLQEVDLLYPRLPIYFSSIYPTPAPHFQPPPPPPPPPAALHRRHWPIPTPPPSPRHPDVPPAVNPGDYFTGTAGMNELIEEITQNDRPGQPPAAAAAIAAMPAVRIAEWHLEGGSQCPVCKEDFGIGEEAMEMPCKHVYHSDCIVPWLRIHNSCPVCRSQLPTAAGDAERRRSNRDGGGGGGGNWEYFLGGDGGWEDGSRRLQGRWNRFFQLWPSHPPPPPAAGWDNHHRSRRPEDDDPSENAGNGLYSWWRSLFLL